MRQLFRTAGLRIARLGIVAVCGLVLSVQAQVSPPATGSASATRRTVDSLQRLTQPGYYSALFAARQQAARLAATTCNTYLCATSPAPSVTLVNNGPLSCSLTSVTLTATGSPAAGGTYAFAGPDGPLSSSGNTALATKAGNYTVTMTVSGGQSATALTTVTSATGLTATISGALTVCAGSTTSLTADGGESFRWSTGATTATISATAGTYSVTAITGSCQATATASVSLCTPTNTPPVATTNASQTAIVGRAFAYTVNAFTDAETPGSLTYTASIEPAGNNTLSFNPGTRVLSGSISEPSVVSVTITATDPGGLSASTSFTIIANRNLGNSPLRFSNLTASPATLSTTGTTLLSATASGGTSPYRYSFAGPGTIVPNGNTATVSGLPAGVQTFTVLVSDVSSPTSQTASATVSVTVSAGTPCEQSPAITTLSGQPYPGGVSSLTISQKVGNVILTAGGCAGGTLTWAGGSATTLSVSTVSTGVQTFTAVCQTNGCTSPVGTATVTVVAPTLRVLSRDPDNGQLNNNTLKPYLLLQNLGNTPVAYPTITLRYWLTTENTIPLLFQKNYVALGQSNLGLRYVALAQPRQGATGYIEYSFQPGAGSLAPRGDSGPLEVQINKQDYSVFDQRDDYSYVNNSNYTLNPRITAYQNGVIFYGQEPTGVGSARVGVVEPGVGLQVVVLGNPVVGQAVTVEVSGAEGQPLRLQVMDQQGRLVNERLIEQAGAVENQTLTIGQQPAGLLLLRVSTPTQSQTVKVLKTD